MKEKRCSFCGTGCIQRKGYRVDRTEKWARKLSDRTSIPFTQYRFDAIDNCWIRRQILESMRTDLD